MDAFPDYTRFDHSKKVLAAIQIISGNTGDTALRRASTSSSHTHEEDNSGIIDWTSKEIDTKYNPKAGA